MTRSCRRAPARTDVTRYNRGCRQQAHDGTTHIASLLYHRLALQLVLFHKLAVLSDVQLRTGAARGR
jgi:hypothetical protein